MKHIVGVIAFIASMGMAIAGSVIQSISTTTTAIPSLVDGTSKLYPISVTMIPQSGVTGTIEYSTSPNAYAAPAGAYWNVLAGASAVSAVTTTSIASPVTAIRFTRVSGASAVIGEVDWRVAP